jgi:hypothetical protein
MGFQNLLLLPLLISSSAAWLVTSYYETVVSATPFLLDGNTFTQTQSYNIPISTSGVTGVSSDTRYDDDVTIIEIYLTGSNLPVLSTTSSIDPCASWTGFPGECTSVIGTPTTTYYYAPLTVTQPSSCSQTKFSFCKILLSLSKTLNIK